MKMSVKCLRVIFLQVMSGVILILNIITIIINIVEQNIAIRNGTKLIMLALIISLEDTS